MRIRFQNELWLVDIMSVLLLIIITVYPFNGLRVILGIPFVLFFPGYALVSALFPRGNYPGGIARIALSFGLSIVVSSLVGLALNYTPWGISLYSVYIAVAGFTVVASVAGWMQRRRLPLSERFIISFNLGLFTWKGRGLSDRILSVTLVVAVLVTLGALGYAVISPKSGEKFTEFYILGASGKAVDYPRQLKIGEEDSVIIGIVNQEGETLSYWVEVNIDGIKNKQVGPLLLRQDEKWEGVLSFVPDRAGDNQKVEFLLHKVNLGEPNPEKLHIWIDVTR